MAGRRIGLGRDQGGRVVTSGVGGDSVRAQRRPLVSIGLPVHEGERFLRDAVDSLLAQDCPDFELIVSDNASTDATREIAEQYAASDERVRYIRQDQQLGAARNFNAVAAQARGTYFKWAAHDDLCGPTFLSRCLDVLESSPDVVLCYPRAAEIDAAGEVTKQFPAYDFAHERQPSARVRSFLTERPACLEVYGLMRREVLLTTRMIGPFSSSDGVFLLEMMLRGRFQRVDSVEFFCRKHPERSLERYRGSRRQWYDATARAGRGFPEWRLTAELLRAVREAPVERVERTRALGHVARWTAAMSPVLLRDAAATAKATALSARRVVARRFPPSEKGAP